MFMFAFRFLFDKFGETWVGLWHDKNYTYIIDGTKETHKETFVPWIFEPITNACGVLENNLKVASASCKRGHVYGLCEKPVCAN